MLIGLLTGIAVGGVLVGYAHVYPILGVMLAALLAYLVLLATDA
jgi:hypothetical protein